MNILANTNIEAKTPDTEPRVLEYGKLVDSIQVSLARQLHVPGALEAHTFAEALEPFDDTERERIVCEVGERFDDEMVYFVTCSLMVRRNRTMVIMAEESEGFNGYLPWQSKLEEHIEQSRADGSLPNARITVERYTAPSDARGVTALGEAALTRVVT